MCFSLLIHLVLVKDGEQSSLRLESEALCYGSGRQCGDLVMKLILVRLVSQYNILLRAGFER